MNIQTLPLPLLFLCATISLVCMEQNDSTWTNPKSLTDLKPFANKMVLYKNPLSIPNAEYLYRINQEDKIFCGLVDETNTFIIKCLSTQRKKIYRQQLPIYLSDEFLQENSFKLRLLTLKEVHHLHKAKELEEIECFDYYLFDRWPIFKLHNLTCHEQQRYIENQRKNMEDTRKAIHQHSKDITTLRLVYKFRQSSLNRLPKNVFNMVITRMIDLELLQNHGSLTLHLPSKKNITQKRSHL